jgi:hypothetical protein
MGTMRANAGNTGQQRRASGARDRAAQDDTGSGASQTGTGSGGTPRARPADPAAEASRAVAAGFAAAREMSDSVMAGFFGRRSGAQSSGAAGADAGFGAFQKGTGGGGSTMTAGPTNAPFADILFNFARAGFAMVESAALGLAGGVGSGDGFSTGTTELTDKISISVSRGTAGEADLTLTNGPSQLSGGLHLSSDDLRNGADIIPAANIQFSDNPVVLNPRQTKSIKLTITVDEDTKANRTYTGLVRAAEWPTELLILEVHVP